MISFLVDIYSFLHLNGVFQVVLLNGHYFSLQLNNWTLINKFSFSQTHTYTYTIIFPTKNTISDHGINSEHQYP